MGKDDRIVNEAQVKEFHSWISVICDPDTDLCSSLTDQFQRVDEWSARVQTGDRIAHISPKGIFGADELDVLDEDQIEDGSVRVVGQDDTLLEGTYKDGSPHGFFRVINEYGDLDYFGCIVNGIQQGVCWRSVAGGGFLISPNWKFSGDNMIYLYPDCRLGFRGEFEEALLTTGLLVEVTGYVTTLQDAVMVPELRTLSPDKEYRQDLSTIEKLSNFPLLPDPYEDIFVEVGASRVSHAGQGLFAKVDIEVGTVISFYNGLRVDAGRDSYKPSPYAMTLDEKIDLDLPEEMTSIDAYAASLGHKVCHSFVPNCETDLYQHPRFGLIRCIVSLQDIRPGQEIYINYKYNLSTAPNWYKIAWAKHQKIVRGLPEFRTAVLFSGLQVQGGSSRRSSYFSDLG